MPDNSIFKPHGAMSSRVDGRVLIVEVDGSWNLQMLQKSRLVTAPLVAELNASGPWANLVILKNTLVTSLEVLAAGRQSVIGNPAVSQLRALAWVIAPEVEGYPLLLPQFRGIYAGVLDSEIFPSEAPAREWLLSRL